MKTIKILRGAWLTIFVSAFLGVSIFAHEGNKHPNSAANAAVSSTTDTNAASETKTDSTPEPPEITDFPNYHPLIVHFPIVLLLAATGFQAISFFAYRNEFGLAVLILLSLGTISAWLASDVFHVHPTELTDQAREIFEQHELMADLTFWLAVAGLLAKAASHFLTKHKWWSEAIVFLLLLGASVTVSIAGHRGAQLVHIKGVGPQGKFLEMHNH